MPANSKQENRTLLIRFFLTSLLIVAALSVNSFGQSSSPQMVDVYIKWGNADYLDLSEKKVLPASTAFTFGERNLQSFVVGYKAWNLLGDFVYNPSFYYEIDQTKLRGKTQTVEFDKISKYPDLAKRYQAMRPSSVNFVITADLITTDGKSKTVYFKVSDNALGYTDSRSGRNVQSPISPASGKWKHVFSVQPTVASSTFTDADYSDEKELKELLKNFRELSPCSVGCRGGVRVSFDIKWPDDAIDEISRLYDQYEKENKKIDDELRAIKEADKLVKPVAAYNKDDEMSAPFEEEAKSAEVFKEGDTVGLRAKGKVVFTSSAYSSAEPIDAEKKLFKFSSREGGLHLYDAKGKRLSVGGKSSFSSIKEGRQAGTYQLIIPADSSYPAYTSRYKQQGWGRSGGNKGYLTQSEVDQYLAGETPDEQRCDSCKPGDVYMVMPTNFIKFYRSTLYTVDNKLKIINTETVYTSSR